MPVTPRRPFEFFLQTREQVGDWCGAGVREVQRAVDGNCSQCLLSFDATERNWCPGVLEFQRSEYAPE